MSDSTNQFGEAKQVIRRRAYQIRADQPDKVEASRRAVQRLLGMEAYQQAATALWYVDCRSELRTRQALPTALKSGQCIAVPFCTTDQHGDRSLAAWQLKTLDELTEGMWKILEPPPARRADSERQVPLEQIDVVIVPGVAFTRQGDRLGNGYGYYDRLLAHIRADCTRIGLCFESQLWDQLPCGPHDVPMHWVVTENTIYP